jgi:cbb3-type cytochrome oxidase maturation protein
MNVIFLLLPLALLLALVFVLFYLWAARHEQFDDLDSPARRMLLDDPPPQEPPKDPSRPPR